MNAAKLKHKILASPKNLLVATALAAATVFAAVATAKLLNQSVHARRFECKPGPWGYVECVRIAIEMPESFVSLDQIRDIHAHWFFKNHTKAQVEALFQSAGLPAAQLNSLLHEAKWEQTTDGWWVSPSDALVLTLPQPARQKIYTLLANFQENNPQYYPFTFRPEVLESILRDSQLSEVTENKLKTLFYQRGQMTLFSDLDLLVNSLSNDDEKERLLKTISRTSTLLVKLKVDEQTSIESLVNYWGYGGRAKDVRALLQSMAQVPGGAIVDAAHLLPPFVRQRIYTYPDPSALNVTNQHCHWSSLNFFNITPDDRCAQEAYATECIRNEYHPIPDSPRLGDIILFLDPDGALIHSAAYIADNIVFTKNGGAPNRPWIYMELEDLMAAYAKPMEPLRTVILRRKTI